MFSFLNNLFTVTGNNNTMYSKNRIGNRNVHSKLPIVVVVIQINSISLIESEEFRETSNKPFYSIESLVRRNSSISSRNIWSGGST